MAHKDPTEASFNDIFRSYRRNAQAKSLEFSLNKEQFRALTKGFCHYCGRAPYKSYLVKDGRSPYVYNGVDRIDNAKGYTKSNAVSCCTECNYVKWTSTPREFIEQVLAIVTHQVRKQFFNNQENNEHGLSTNRKGRRLKHRASRHRQSKVAR